MLNDFIAIACGGFVGFTLRAIGGGGSVVAIPLLLYLVGLSPHVAIGTGALAVSASAFFNFAAHSRAGNVRRATAAIFAAAGVVGAFIGFTIGKAVDRQRLVLLFAVTMIVIDGLMLRPRRASGPAAGRATLSKLAVLKLVCVGLAVGHLAGFFGIGGGVLTVPRLILATGMPMINAIGTSLLAVGAFGLATALNYAVSGLVEWLAAAEFIGGGLAGGWLGMKAACQLAAQRNSLNRMFAGLVFAVDR